jgi:hypothetical protein
MEQQAVGPPQDGALAGIRHIDVLRPVTPLVPVVGEGADEPDLILDGQIRLPKEKESVLAHGLVQRAPVGRIEWRREIKVAYPHPDAFRQSV